jgi:hypothetical protein
VHTSYITTDENSQQHVNTVTAEASGIPAALGVSI